MTTDVLPTREQLEEARTAIDRRAGRVPRVGLILGSGLGLLAEEVENAVTIPYEEIPYFPTSTVEGHSGQLILGTLGKQVVVVMQGRVHFYEGYSMRTITFPVRVMGALGIQQLIVTNAAGGLAPYLAPGELMLISDHINLVGMGGHHPLIGPNDSELGPRFPDMAEAYDPGLRTLARQVAERAQIPLHEGVYVYLAGPSFETPHEVHFLRMIGADAVGMSTVPEVIVARHMGVRVLGISGITNVHSTDLLHPRETTHAEVLEAGKVIAPRMAELIQGILVQL
jgi:purine-nucleoside phosphorylase